VPDPAAPDVAGAQSRRDTLINERGRLAKELALLTKESEKLLKYDDCPTCGTPGSTWKKKLSTKYATQIKNTAEAIAKVDEKTQTVEAELETLISKGEQVRQIRRKNANFQTNIDTWTGRREGIQSRKDAWDKELERVKKQFDGLPKVEPVNEEELNKLDANRKAARQTLDELVDRKAVYERYLQDVKRAAQAAIEHNQAKARLAVAKKILAVLQDVKTVIVDGAFMELLRVANSIVGPVLPTPLAFFEGEVGRWSDHLGASPVKFIGHGTFSGTEQALTFVAIAAALAQQSPLRILIFDEMGRLDEERQNQVVILLEKALQKGFIDQFIVVGAISDISPALRGLQVISLE
jgi:DNA repair exonuclease SbcCD ATPase subunit